MKSRGIVASDAAWYAADERAALMIPLVTTEKGNTEMNKHTKTTKTGNTFRNGSNMQKGFMAYQAIRKTYVKADAVTRRKHAERIAKKLDTTLNSVRTMICKNWEPALKH